jgi:hypothetical protein
MTDHLAAPLHRRVQYQIGDLVAVDRTALPPGGGCPHPTRTNWVRPPPWLAALIEGIHAVPGAEPTARYRIRILDGPFYGLQWQVSIHVIRPWRDRHNPPSTEGI